MPAYRLLCTRQNRDGSFDTPSVDMPIEAADDGAAIALAHRFPRSAYGESNVAWLVDKSCRVVWTSASALSHAA